MLPAALPAVSLAFVLSSSVTVPAVVVPSLSLPVVVLPPVGVPDLARLAGALLAFLLSAHECLTASDKVRDGVVIERDFRTAPGIVHAAAALVQQGEHVVDLDERNERLGKITDVLIETRLRGTPR